MADAKAKLEAKKSTKSKAKKSTKKDEKASNSTASKTVKAKTKQKFDASKVTLAELAKMKKEYADLRLSVTLGKEQDPSKVRHMRRNIARALTYLNSNKETETTND